MAHPCTSALRKLRQDCHELQASLNRSEILSFSFLFHMYECLSACMKVHYVRAWYSQSQKVVILSPGIGVTGGYKLHVSLQVFYKSSQFS